MKYTKRKTSRIDIEAEIVAIIRKNGVTIPPHVGHSLRSLELLNKLNDQREMSKRKSFSPTTFDKYMKSLSKEGIVKRRVISHKNVVYELDEIKSTQWAYNNMMIALSDFLVLMPMDLVKLDRKLELTDIASDATMGINHILKGMNTVELEKIKKVSQWISETIEEYLKCVEHDKAMEVKTLASQTDRKNPNGALRDTNEN